MGVSLLRGDPLLGSDRARPGETSWMPNSWYVCTSTIGSDEILLRRAPGTATLLGKEPLHIAAVCTVRDVAGSGESSLFGTTSTSVTSPWTVLISVKAGGHSTRPATGRTGARCSQHTSLHKHFLVQPKMSAIIHNPETKTSHGIICSTRCPRLIMVTLA